MRAQNIGLLPAFLLGCSVAAFGQNPSTVPQQPGQAAAPPATTKSGTPPQEPKGRSIGGEMGSGAGDIGKGTGEGVGKAAEGVGKGAGDLVTLHPLGAAENVGKGAGVGAKDVGVGAAKGTGKVAKGTGKLFAKPFHHSKKTEEAPPASSENPH
jgi:hypothetical protein